MQTIAPRNLWRGFWVYGRRGACITRRSSNRFAVIWVSDGFPHTDTEVEGTVSNCIVSIYCSIYEPHSSCVPVKDIPYDPCDLQNSATLFSRVSDSMNYFCKTELPSLKSNIYFDVCHFHLLPLHCDEEPMDCAK